jgi:hypothetical protein
MADKMAAVIGLVNIFCFPGTNIGRIFQLPYYSYRLLGILNLNNWFLITLTEKYFSGEMKIRGYLRQIQTFKAYTRYCYKVMDKPGQSILKKMNKNLPR